MTGEQPRGRVHYGDSFPTCRTRARNPRCSARVVDVTCNLCVYRLWRTGRIDHDDDHRITASMRAHAAANPRIEGAPEGDHKHRDPF